MTDKIQHLASQARDAVKKSKSAKDDYLRRLYQGVANRLQDKIEALKTAQRAKSKGLKNGQ